MFEAWVDVVLFEPPPPPQAASVETSAASASSGKSRFTDCPPMCRIQPREATLPRERGGGERLEMGDQLLALAHEDAVLDPARGDSALYALDERQVFLSDLLVEREELLDPRRLDVRAEEVVEEAVRPVGRQRYERADREVRVSRKDVDPEVRPEEVELRARQLLGGRDRPRRTVLGREPPVGREQVRLG